MSKFLLVSLTLLFSMTMAYGQGTSGVTGTVTDTTGAVVPGVKVTLLDTRNSREQSTVTSDKGAYSFTNLQPGAGYRITVTGQGFQTFVLDGVQIGVMSDQTHNIQLTPGQISETVTVISTSGDATLNTTDSSIGNIIGARQLRELPIQLRGSPAALIGLQPGAVGTNVFAGATSGNRTGSVAGSRADQGNVTLDGIDVNDQAGNFAFATVANAPIDSVQEFRAVTSGAAASSPIVPPPNSSCLPSQRGPNRRDSQAPTRPAPKRPSAASSRRKAAGSVKAMPCMPSALAAAALRATSSI